MADRGFRSRVPGAAEVAARLPKGVSAALGVAAIAVGALLVVRPLTSLTALAVLVACGCVVTGVGELVLPRRAGRPAMALAAGWVLVGVLMLVQMGWAIDLLPRFVAAVLVVGGLVRVAAVRRGALDDRLTAGLLGVAEVVLGVVAWLWPDVTLLVVAVLFGIRTVALGAGLLWAARPGAHTALASGLVLVPRDAPPDPRPVVAWAHGTTGYATGCAPTLLAHPLASGAMPALPQLLAEGWALVATDYTGLGTAGPHPYLIGTGEGHSVLDAVRAARHLDDIELADRTVVWGHSQGGHAALWTGLLAPTYAPDTNVVAVAAMAPASDAVGLVRHLPSVTGGSVFSSYVVAAYTATYPDVGYDTYIIPAARTLVRDMSRRCLAEPGMLVSVLTALSIDKDHPIFAIDPLQGPFGARLRENTPAGSLTVPLLLAQGGADPLIAPAIQDAYAKDRCGEGWNIDYRVYPGRDHVGVVAADSPLIPDLISWTRDRFAGYPQARSCPS